MKIYAPVKDFNGLRGNVRFTRGVGETNDPHLIKWFETHGYTVENEKPLNLVIDELIDELENTEEEPVEMMGYSDKTPTLEEMNPNELREFAKANGKGHLIKNIRNKEKLIEIITMKE